MAYWEPVLSSIPTNQTVKVHSSAQLVGSMKPYIWMCCLRTLSQFICLLRNPDSVTSGKKTAFFLNTTLMLITCSFLWKCAVKMIKYSHRAELQWCDGLSWPGQTSQLKALRIKIILQQTNEKETDGEITLTAVLQGVRACFKDWGVQWWAPAVTSVAGSD